MRTIEEIKKDINDGIVNRDVLIQELSTLISSNPTNDEAYLQRGLLHWRAGQRAKAINDYNQALRINPDSEARLVLKATYDILNFYNKDLFNP